MPVAISTFIRESVSMWVMMNIGGRVEYHRNVKCKDTTNRLGTFMTVDRITG